MSCFGLAIGWPLATIRRVLGGGSATVFPSRIVSPLDGLTAALPEGTLGYAVGADPNTELAIADQGLELRVICRDIDGAVIGTCSSPNGDVHWTWSDLPEGVTRERLHTVELAGTFTPRDTGRHTFGAKGIGGFRLSIDGTVHYDDIQRPDTRPDWGPAAARIECHPG